jgi:Na+-translocating ferredoxin:NAD+ oxidoreductase RnfG subunit
MNFMKRQIRLGLLVALVLCLSAMLFGCFNNGPSKNNMFEDIIDGEYEIISRPDDASNEVTVIYKVTKDGEFAGYICVVRQPGFTKEIELHVGFNKYGKVAKVKIASEQETHGQDLSPMLNNLAVNSYSDIDNVECITGATITSNIIKNGVKLAFRAVDSLYGFECEDEGEEEEEKPNDPFFLFREVLNGEDYTEISLNKEMPASINKFYKVTEGENTIGYIAIVEKRGYSDSIIMTVGIDTDGKVTKVVINQNNDIYGHDLSSLSIQTKNE